VVEALNALAGYLDEAVKSAARIPAGKVAQLNLENIPRDLGPRLTAVHLTEDGDENAFCVEGFYLKDVNTFRLVKGTTQITTEIQTKQPTTFTAKFKGTLPRGRYDALVIDEGGQAFVLRNAVAVGRPKYDPWLQQQSSDPHEFATSSIGERPLEKKSSKGERRR